MATTMGTQVETLKNYVAGQWVEATATEMQAVRNPATDDVLAHVPLSNAEDVDTAVRAAAAAFPPGSTPPQERARYFFTLRELLVEHREELARLIVTEMGKTLDDARGEVQRGSTTSRPPAAFRP